LSRRLKGLAAGLSVLAFAWVPGAASAKDYALIARDIVPSGQYGSVPPPAQATQQAQMYNALTPLFNHVTSSDLLADFKPDQARLPRQRCGRTVHDRVRSASGRDDPPRPLRRPADHRRDARRRYLGGRVGRG
jgi:hypothetical protein